MVEDDEKKESPEEAKTREDIRSLNEDIAKEFAAIPKQDTTFRVLKDPGDRRSFGWAVATLSSVAYEELHKAFRDPWVWGAKVLGEKFKGKIVCEWGFKGPDDREWSLCATFSATKAIELERKADWTLGGQGTDYDEFVLWLGRRLNRQLSVTSTDDDCIAPRTKGVAELFGEVILAPETVTPPAGE